MYTIRKLFHFEAAHALTSSYSKCCQQFHGHSYLVELFFRSEKLNADGMVMDFGQVKDLVGGIVNQWDHKMVIPTNHDIKVGFIALGEGVIAVPYNPTAENMARNFYDQIKNVIPCLSKVRVHETATGWAEFSEEP